MRNPSGRAEKELNDTEERERGRFSRKLWRQKGVLILLLICLSCLNIRLAGSHMARSFHYLRKHGQADTAFVFGVLFWGFLLALPLAIIPFGKLKYKHRYVICAMLIMIFIDLLYLFSFLSSLLFSHR
jgi:Na+/melibiose symporter-like transporter